MATLRTGVSGSSVLFSSVLSSRASSSRALSPRAWRSGVAAFLTILLPGAALAAPQNQPSAAAGLDAKISQYLQRIQAAQETPSDTDKLQKVNAEFLAFMQRTLEDAGTLTVKLPKSGDAGLKAFGSDDGLVRFYSWDTGTGGTMHFYVDLVQFKGAKGVHVRKFHPDGSEGDTGYFYHDVHSIRTADGKAVYLPTYRAIYSGPDHSDGITAYAIKGDDFVKVPVFKTKTQLLDSIDVPASLLEWDDRDLIKFKDNVRTLLIPLIGKDNKVTGRYLIYKFDGGKFVFDPKAR